MIYISAGHRGPKTGAVGIIDEGAETIDLRNDIIIHMMSGTASNANMRHDNDRAQLAAVIQDVNRWCTDRGRDFAIELHFNASTNPAAHGTECIIADKHSRRSEQIAKRLTDTICQVLGTMDRTHGRGYKTESQSARGRLGFLSETRCPAVIVEVCFVSSEADCTAYQANRDRLAESIAKTLRTLSEP